MHVGPLTWWMAEQLPDVQTRNTAIGIAYNVASMVHTHSSAPTLFTALTLQRPLFSYSLALAAMSMWSDVCT